MQKTYEQQINTALQCPRFNGLLGLLGVGDDTLKYPNGGSFGLLSAPDMLFSGRAFGVNARPRMGGLRRGGATSSVRLDESFISSYSRFFSKSRPWTSFMCSCSMASMESCGERTRLPSLRRSLRWRDGSHARWPWRTKILECCELLVSVWLAWARGRTYSVVPVGDSVVCWPFDRLDVETCDEADEAFYAVVWVCAIVCRVSN
jgi:hypothetical protein